MSSSGANNRRSRRRRRRRSANSSISENSSNSSALELEAAPVHEENGTALPQTAPLFDLNLSNRQEENYLLNMVPELDYVGLFNFRIMATLFGEGLANVQHPITMRNYTLFSETILEGLQLRNYRCMELEANRRQDPCCICMDELGNDEYLIQLDCNHHFHFDCIKRWLEEKNQCPVCRKIGIPLF